MSHDDVNTIRSQADMIVCGYACIVLNKKTWAYACAKRKKDVILHNRKL